MNELILAFVVMIGAEQINQSLRPQPTKEQIALIEKLGDDDWLIREKADKQLREMGYDALVALEKKGLMNECMEIQSRATEIHKNYFRISSSNHNIPMCTGLFKLGDVRLYNGKIVKIPSGTAKKYLLRLTGGNEEHPIFYCYDFEDNEWMLTEATVLFTKDLYKYGYRQEEVIQILNIIEINQDKWMPYDLQHDEDNIHFSGQHKIGS